VKTSATAASAQITPVKSAEAAGEDVRSKAEALEKQGNWNLLVIYTTEWTRKQPFDAEAWRTLSVGYVKLRQYREALEAAEKAVQLSPVDSRLWQNLGQINLAVPRPAEALTAFQHATALSDRDVVSLVQVGVLNTQLGHLAEARAAFDQALTVSPVDIPALCGAATLAQKEGRAKDAAAMNQQVTTLDARCPSPVEGETVRVATAPPAKKPSPSAR
jgi:tetratricopeptide (TPR) repeat protein